VAYRWIRHGVVDSTSERAFADIASGEARSGDVHIAQGQTAGRGRRGRQWHSSPDEGLYLSLILMPPPPPLKPAAITIAAGLAVIEALSDLGLPPTGERGPRLDWPNDVMAGEAKLCGILTESRGLDPGAPHYVLGIGLNVRQRFFPAELQAQQPVTSLTLLGLDVGIEEAARAVLTRLEGRLHQVRGRHRLLADDFLTASHLTDRLVCVHSGKKVRTGRVQGMTLSDGLELRTDTGEDEVLPLEFVGSVEFLRED